MAQKSALPGVVTMKLDQVRIENYRAIELLTLRLHPQLTVLHGDNGHGKTSVLNAIAVGLGSIPRLLPNVSSIDFLKTDHRELQPHLVQLITTDWMVWERRKNFGVPRKPGVRSRIASVPLPGLDSSGNPVGLRNLREVLAEIVDADMESKPPIDLPIVAFYDTDRAVLDVPQRRRGSRRELTRYDALEGALSARSDFRDFFNWFDAKEGEELRKKRDLRDFDYQLNELNAVRSAIESMIPGVSQPRTTRNPTGFVVSVKRPDGEGDTELAISQLSGGYRIMLALAADLARRMAQGNPHKDDPLQSEAIVLIDEVDLHLHPSWQQRVLPDLMRTFPNAQFIVSTHSPQVLTTVEQERVVRLYWEGDGIAAAGAGGHTYGAPAGDVLTAVMGVDERPPKNEFAVALDEYMRLVDDGKGKSKTALQLRSKLERLSPDDYALDRADIEMMVQEVVNSPGEHSETH